MNPQLPHPEIESDASVRWLVKSLASGFVESLRRNKLAAVLAFTTLVVSIVLTLRSDFDERPRYQRFILPNLARAEAPFLASVRFLENAPEAYRLQYFLNAHAQVKDVLRAAKRDWPTTSAGRRAHREFIRYYQLMDEEFAIIRTEMSVKDVDYLGRWRTAREELRPIREHWAAWVAE